MTNRSIRLKDIHIASPCPSSWEAMYGDDQVRYCNVCSKNVYNLSAMTRAEAEILLNKMQGGLCARIFLRKDGSVMTSDCPVGLARLRRLVAKRIAAVATLVLGMCSGLSALIADRILASAISRPVEPVEFRKPSTPRIEIPQNPSRIGKVAYPMQMQEGITAPVLIHKPEPDFLQHCKFAGPGVALYKMIVNQFGMPSRIETLRSPSASLDECVKEVLQEWRFKPACYEDEPVSVFMTIAVRSH